MIRLIIIALIAGAVYFVYNNWTDLSSTMLNSAKQEKTIQAVGGTRSELGAEAKDALAD